MSKAGVFVRPRARPGVKWALEVRILDPGNGSFPSIFWGGAMNGLPASSAGQKNPSDSKVCLLSVWFYHW